MNLGSRAPCHNVEPPPISLIIKSVEVASMSLLIYYSSIHIHLLKVDKRQLELTQKLKLKQTV